MSDRDSSMRTRTIILWAVVVLNSGLLCQTAYSAQRRTQNRGRSGQSSQQLSAARSHLTDAQKSAVEAQQAFVRAQQKRKRAIADRGKVRRELLGTVASDNELERAEEQMDAAQNEAERIRVELLETLRTEPEYQDLAVDLEEQRQLLADMRAIPSADPAAVKALAKQVAQMAMNLKQTESTAFGQDRRYQQAQQKFLIAAQRVKAIRQRLEQSMHDDKRFQSAAKKVDQAEEELARAARRLADERRSMAAAQILVQRSVVQAQFETERRLLRSRGGRSNRGRGNRRRR